MGRKIDGCMKCDGFIHIYRGCIDVVHGSIVIARVHVVC